MFIGLDGPLVETGEKRDRWVRRTGGGGAGEAEEAEEKEERERRGRGEEEEKKGDKHITIISPFGMKVKLNGLFMRAMNCLGVDMYYHQSIPLALLLH